MISEREIARSRSTILREQALFEGMATRDFTGPVKASVGGRSGCVR